LVRGGDSPWFYSGLTQNPSAKRDELFHQAGLLAFQKISQTLGPDPQKWEWGKVHRLEFLSPILREGLGKGWLGAGSHPMAGSGETLYRAIYDFVNPFQVTTSASLRMVADLSDDEKICAVLPGGVSGRLFHPHYKDQTPAFLNGGKLYWWFGDKAIHEHQRSALFLQPK
jgi:penicillin amidase